MRRLRHQPQHGDILSSSSVYDAASDDGAAYARGATYLAWTANLSVYMQRV